MEIKQSMNKLIIPFLFIACFFVASCRDDEPKDRTKDIMMSVSEEPGVMYDLFDDEGKYPIMCLRVMDEDFPGEWRNLSMNAIEGFEYEIGHMYTIRVRRTILANPPADASSYTYKLLAIHEDRIWPPVEEPKEEIIVNKEEDIPYEEDCPYHIYEVYRGASFVVDGEGKIGHEGYSFDEYVTYDYSDAALRFEKVIPRESPDFLKFSKIAKMAYFAYVIPSSNDNVQKVRIDRTSLFIKNIISERLFNEIATEYKSGQSLEYNIVLANIHGYGLQKIKFSITKVD